MKNENILYVERNVLASFFDLKRRFWYLSEDQLNTVPFAYVPRAEAEADPTKKQLIPYALVFNSKRQLLTYSRKGSEKRLSGIKSVGWGGHVNDGDEKETLALTLLRGLARELREEMDLDILSLSCQMLGMINEEETEVGLSHTGVVFSITIPDSLPLNFNNEIGDAEWKSITEIELEHFELWSVLALKLCVE